MSLFASIQNSANSLIVSQLGLDVTGNNIANANTPGYIRQELVQATGPGYRVGDVILGYGVRATGVVQKIDTYLNERLRNTNSELARSETLGDIYNQIEASFAELGDNDLSSQLANFSGSIQDLLNQPGNESLRRLVLERGQALTEQVKSLNRDLTSITNSLNGEIQTSASEINRLTSQLAKLNQRIVSTEGGRTSGSDAVGLRDERLKVLDDLSQIVDIRAVEQPSGSVTVYVGGEYLVADGIQRTVQFSLRKQGDELIPEVHLSDTDSPLQVSSGRLKGLYDARDGAAAGATNNLNEFAKNLIEQFNRIHSQGQGLEGYKSIVSDRQVDDTTAPLDLAGLGIDLENGSFEITVRDAETGQDKTSVIRVQLTGGTSDTTLDDIRSQISAVSGLSASITADGGLRIDTTNPKLRFAFGKDTSGFLAGMGINSFFHGDSASNLEVNPDILSNPRLLGASLSGIGGGTENAVRLAQAFDEPLGKLNGQSLKQNYENMVVSLTQDINVQKGTTDGLRNFQKTLESQHLATSGVNLDEEAVKMIFYQRVFQASSRVIKAASDMLDTLVNL